MKRPIYLPLLGLAVLTTGLTFYGGENLLPNGSFERIDEEADLPDGWLIEQKDKVKLVKEGSNHWIAFRDGGRIKSMIDVKPEWKYVHVAAQMRTKDIKRGVESWNLPRITLVWTTKDKPVSQGLEQVEDMDWFLREAAFQVPGNAVKLQVEPGLFECQGTFEVDDISVTAIDQADVKKLNDSDWRQKHTVMLKNGTFEHGTFELLNKDGKPRGWQSNSNCKVVADGANHYAEVSSPNETWSNFETRLRVRPEWSGLKASARMKIKDLKMGKEGWQTSRIAFTFVDAEDQKVGDWPPSLELKADTDWTDVSKALTIPQGAYALKISAGLHNASGTFAFDDIKVEPVMGAGMALAEPGAVSSSARRAASQAPTVKLAEVGLEFNPAMAQQLLVRRVKPEAAPLTLLSIGPSAPGSNGAPKARAVKYPAHWKPQETPREMAGTEASPNVLLVKLPEILLAQKPEVVLLWSDADTKRKTSPSERHEWEDVVTVCLRMGSLPVLVLPNGQVSFGGGGGSVDLIKQPKKEEEKGQEQDADADLEALRRTMIMVGGSQAIPMVEQAPFATASDRLGKILNLVEEFVLGRQPPQTKSGPEETGGKPKPPDEVE